MGVGQGADNVTTATGIVTKHEHVPRTWTDSLVQPKQWKRDMRFGTWSVRSLYRSGLLATAVRELARCKLYLVGVHEVKWEKGGTVRAGDYMFFYKKGSKNHQLGTGYFVHHRMLSAVKRVQFVCDRMSNIVLRGHYHCFECAFTK